MTPVQIRTSATSFECEVAGQRAATGRLCGQAQCAFPTGPSRTQHAPFSALRSPASGEVDVEDVFDFLHYAYLTSWTSVACLHPFPALLARFMRFVPAVRPACGILRVLRRNNPFVGLAACRRSRVPTRLTFEDGLAQYRLTKGDVHYDVQCTKARKLLYKPPSLNGIGFRRPVRVLKVVHYNPASAERFRSGPDCLPDRWNGATKICSIATEAPEFYPPYPV